MPESKHCSILKRSYLISLLKFPNLRILYIFVLRMGNPTAFVSNVVGDPCAIQIIYIQISQNA